MFFQWMGNADKLNYVSDVSLDSGGIMELLDNVLLLCERIALLILDVKEILTTPMYIIYF